MHNNSFIATMLRCGLIALFVTAITLPIAIAWLRRREVMDVPNERSSHVTPTPRGGGIAPMIGIFAALAATGQGIAYWLLVPIGVATITGGVEDLRGLGISSRLCLTALAGGALLGGLSAVGAPMSARTITILLFTVPWMISVVNAVNFMDGINGITSATAIVCGVSFSLLGSVVQSATLVAVGISVAAATAAFLPFNFPVARVFLGDVGSYGLGAALACMSSLALIEGAPLEAAVSPLALYLADTGRTLFRRATAGLDWRKPHRQHVYQQLAHSGCSHASVTGLVCLVTVALGGLGAVSLLENTTLRVLADVGGVALIYVYLQLPKHMAHRD